MTPLAMIQPLRSVPTSSWLTILAGVGVVAVAGQAAPHLMFVPTYAGLNFEHVLDGTVQERSILFEPRHALMELRVINPHRAELHQAPTPHYGLESCARHALQEHGVLELVFECIRRKPTWYHHYLQWTLEHPQVGQCYQLIVQACCLPVDDEASRRYPRAGSGLHRCIGSRTLVTVRPDPFRSHPAGLH